MEKLPLWKSCPALRLIAFNRQQFRSSPGNRVTHSAHHHSFYEIGFVLAGECTWKIKWQRFVLKAGEAILVKPGSVHFETLSPKGETRLAWLGFDFSLMPPAWAESILSVGSELPEIIHCLHAIGHEHSAPDPITRRRVELALQNVLVLVSRCAERSASLGRKRPASNRSSLNPRQIRSVESSAHYFRHNLEESLSIAQVAAYHSLCPAYFSTLFRRHFRLPPRAFIQQAKVDKAAELLRTSDLTLKEIGSRCGFVDAAHLAKAFKRRHRLTPGAFRRSNRP